jgi:mono/diheme cytochrome c family protein
LGADANDLGEMKRDRKVGRFSKEVTGAILWFALGIAPPMIPTARADDIPPVNPLSGDAKSIRGGKSWFVNVCSPCHGGKADGAGERGTAADLRKWNKGFRKFVETVKDGKNTGRAMTMPAWGAVLDEKTIFEVGAYLETLAIEGANWKEAAAQ